MLHHIYGIYYLPIANTWGGSATKSTECMVFKFDVVMYLREMFNYKALLYSNTNMVSTGNLFLILYSSRFYGLN
jgi:hypothetical protein